MTDFSHNPTQEIRKPLFEFSYIKEMNPVLYTLKGMAMDERWSYSVVNEERPFPVLFNYLLHTFTRLQEEKKVVEKGSYACFNTGLVTEKQEEIFMLFKKFPDREKWTFIEFCKESDGNMNRFSPLPERATYFTEPSELTFDTRLPLRINIDHIIDDELNRSRFPTEIQNYSKHQLVTAFHGALDHAKKRLKRNYKTAIPQYYRGKYNPNGQLQLLLPLCFIDPSKADLALAVYKVIKKEDGCEESFYSGRTCLTLDMAINNARLIAKPDDEWLRP